MKNLLEDIEKEKNALFLASTRSRGRTQRSFADNVNENLIEDLDENLKDVEKTLNNLNQRSTDIRKIEQHLTKLADINSLIKQVSEFSKKLSEWIDEITTIVQKTSTPADINKAVLNIASIPDQNKKPTAILQEIKKAIAKPLKSTIKNIADETQNAESKKEKLTSRISKLTQKITPGKKTVDVLSGIASRLNNSTQSFANSVSNLFKGRTTGSTTRGGKLHLFAIKPNHTSRKNHNKQNNKRSNRRIRKLGVLSKKRNFNIPKSKRNQRKTIHRKSPK
jgi:methyl-accepting chemotaxis protein